MSNPLKLVSAGDMSASFNSGKLFAPNQGDVAIFAIATGTPKGSLKVQGEKPDGTYEDLISKPFSSAARSHFFKVPASRYGELRVRYEADAQPQVTTLTLSAALVALNKYSVTLNGGAAIEATYASSSDETLEALRALLAADPLVASAVITVVGGNQTGVDDRVITLTFVDNTTVAVVAGVTLGASQATVTVANSADPGVGSLDVHALVS